MERNHVRYLYAYDKDKAIQNVGFIKIMQTETKGIANLYTKGLHGSVNGMKLYVTFVENGKCYSVFMGNVERTEPEIQYRLEYTGEDLPNHIHPDEITGVLLKTGEKEYATFWSELPCVVSEIEEYKQSIEEQPKEIEEQPKEIEEQPKEIEEQPEEIEEQPEEIEEQPEEIEEQLEEIEQSGEVEQQGVDDFIDYNPYKYKRIKREDLANLPRSEWQLANNNFLLHGYRNYGFLVIITRGKDCWLGVPGVYHDKEEKIAKAFGFPQFHQPEIDDPNTREYDMEKFGYWCRQIGDISL